MDWRNNIWVGIGAAGLLVVGVVVLVWYAGRSSDSIYEDTVGLTFKCDTCEGTFVIAQKELEDAVTHETYLSKYGEAVLCRLCDDVAAYQVYSCKRVVDEDGEVIKEGCDKVYKYTRSQGVAAYLRCPEGHSIPLEDQ